jgi:CBS domain-containing protein
MSPRGISEQLVREAPNLGVGETVGSAARRIRESVLPALPVVDAEERFVGIFGEREFMAALFPGYVKELGYAGFVPRRLDEALEKRATCRDEPISLYMNTEHIDVGADFSDVEVAETFLHHRVLIVPVVQEGRVLGVITRGAFFRSLAERFLDRG